VRRIAARRKVAVLPEIAALSIDIRNPNYLACGKNRCREIGVTVGPVSGRNKVAGPAAESPKRQCVALRIDRLPCEAVADIGSYYCAYHNPGRISPRNEVIRALRTSEIVSESVWSAASCGCCLLLLFAIFLVLYTTDWVRGIMGLEPKYTVPTVSPVSKMEPLPLKGVDRVYIALELFAPEHYRANDRRYVYENVVLRLNQAGVATMEMDDLYRAPMHPVLNIRVYNGPMDESLICKLDVLPPKSITFQTVWNISIGRAAEAAIEDWGTLETSLETAIAGFIKAIRD